MEDLTEKKEKQKVKAKKSNIHQVLKAREERKEAGSKQNKMFQ